MYIISESPLRILLKNVELPKGDLALDKTVFEPQDKKVAAMAKIQRNLGGKLSDNEGYFGGRAGGGLAKVPSLATMNRLRGGMPSSSEECLVQKQQLFPIASPRLELKRGWMR